MASNLTLPFNHSTLFLILLLLLLIHFPSKSEAKPIEGSLMCSYEFFNRMEKLCEVFSPRCLEAIQPSDLMATAIHCCKSKCTHSFILSSCCSPMDLKSSELIVIPQ